MRTSILQVAATSTTPTLVVSPSPTRAAILFLAPGGTPTITVNVRSPTADGDGIVLQAGSGAVQLTRETHGDIVGQAWFARASANALFTWVETGEVP